MNLKKEPRINLICYGLILLFFAVLACVFPARTYGDSGQFIEMHVLREPVYPLFLWIFRSAFGETLYFSAVSWAQNAFNACATIALLRFFYKEFELNRVVKTLFVVVALMPHVMTPVFSATHMIISCAIMSEALTLPLFYLFMVSLLRLALSGDRRDILWSIIIGVVVSLTRGAMMICLIATAVVWLGRLIFEHQKIYKYALMVCCMLLAIVVRSEAYKAYNYAFNGIWDSDLCKNYYFSTNVIYASHTEDSELISDNNIRAFFADIYDKAENESLTLNKADGNFYDRILHLENSHDSIKFDCTTPILQDYYYQNNGSDYIGFIKYQDEVCAKLTSALLKPNLAGWLADYIGLAFNGMVRSISVSKSYTFIPSLALILISLIGCLVCLFRKQFIKESIILLVVLMMLAANAFGTAIVIMCLSRYMIYTFSLFYMANILLINSVFSNVRKKDRNEL